MTGTASFAIAGRQIGAGHEPFVVAEMSGNHNGDFNRALSIVEAAKAAGADAIKLQTYTADTITLDHDGPGFRVAGGLWDGRTLDELYQSAHTPWDWHRPLFAKARELGLICLSAPFDDTAVALLESLEAPAYKIASFEIVDLALIARAAAAGKPLILSTGMASLAEIGEAVAAARAAGARDIALLHCTSGYPTPPEDSNLRTIPHLAQAFDAVVGLSDHTPGVGAAAAAVALGAAIVEKHFTLARADGGPDAAFSLEPDEFAALVAACRTAWRALGRISYSPAASERPNAQFRRSLYVVADMAEGEAFSADNLRSIRPGHGLAPKHLPVLLGKRVNRAVARGTPASWDLIG
ncbi:MAG: pseudaminic acid synthase [Alphaproteobacteria bacterium]|nr:pseudaminic acid synthase [Alphaproteobacteria bacterium]MDP6518108.1 pseudaminic acid synthase [Alphaproteobacteria bacterium]